MYMIHTIDSVPGNFTRFYLFSMIVDIDVTKLSDSLYSYQHLKAFGNANHLYLDPWNSDTVWFVSNTWTIQRASMQAFNCFSFCLVLS